MLKLIIWTIITVFLGLVSAVIGIVTSLLAAKYSAEPALFLILGAIVYVIVFISGSILFLKRIGVDGKRTYKITAYTVGSLVMVMLAISLLVPFQGEYRQPAAVKGQHFWDLPSGSKIAYVHISSNKNLSLPPIIFLHGGPGVSDMAGDSTYFGQLAGEGHDVYVYDEVGCGLSSRLKDPRGYTIERDVSDLEFIRQKIGSEKVILISHSYGSEVAAHYMAAYGSHVEKAVFISPGAINPNDTSSANLTGRLTSDEKWSVYRRILAPRSIVTYSLLQINPAAAMNFASDKEMDARFDDMYKYTIPALHTRNNPHGPQLSGLGFYANQTPQSAWGKPQQDIRKALAERNTKALIIKASCDYLSWSSAIDYRKALHNSTLVYYSDAGHNVYQDKPGNVMLVIKAFLADHPLPVDVYKGMEPPSDYEGVH